MFVFKEFQLDEMTIKLLLPETSQARDLYRVVKEDRDTLKLWMPWANETHSQRSEAEFLKYIQGRMVDDKVFMLTIAVNDVAVGMVDLHNIDRANRHAEAGYWLSSQVQGHGIMTESLKRLIEYAFHEMGLHKILIQVDTENDPSNAIPKRLGFKLEATFQDQIYFHGQYRDFFEYGLINPE